jgi:hypothetical protein
MQLAVERVADGQASSTNSISVITHGKASPFLA